MTLKQQSNLLACLAVLAVVAVLSFSWLSLRQVRQQTQHISTAEETAKGVSQFRSLIMEAALYREPRSLEQWRRHVASFRAALAGHRYESPASAGLLLREREQLDILARQFERLVLTGHDQPELLAANVSALFLTTQDMGDDAFELMRLERMELEYAQQRAANLMLTSVAVLTVLLAGASVIIRRRVLAPIALLQAGMEQVGQGQLGRRVNLQVPNEIGYLGNVFDNMSEQLQQSRDALAADNAVRHRAQAELLETVRALADKSEELAQTQADLQSIIDHTPALVVYWDRELINRFGNRAYFDWFGIMPEQMKGRHMREIIGAARFDQIAPQMAQVMRGVPQIFERVIDYPNGQQRHALFSYFPDLEDGKVKGCYGFVSDVTQLKQAQAARSAAMERLQNVVDAASDFAIIATDLDGTITLFSKGAEQMLGYGASEMVGRESPPFIHVREEIEARGLALTALLGRKVSGFDVFVEMPRQTGSESRDWTYRRKDGAMLPVNLTVTAMRDAQGAITGYLGVAKDIRQEQEVRRILAEARDQAESANTAKTRFLANMSHEIRTPMNAILGMLRLQRQTPLSPQQLDYATKAESAANSLLGLLNDILDVSRLEANRMTLECTPFRIDALIRDLTPMLTALASAKQLRVVTLVDPALPLCVSGDMMRLRQVLLNLAGNAIKFTTRGEVVLSVDACANGEVGFTVRDTGIGITPEQCATIFDGFSQGEASTSRRFGGSGLGLTISQHLVSLMGGKLEVESTPGVGSQFRFRVALPEASVPLLPAAPHPHPSKPTRRLEGLRLLVVDDNELNLQVARELLAFEGAAVDVADGGLLGVRMVLDAIPPYHAVLMDAQMPDLDGYASTRRLRSHPHLASLPIIAMTANTMAGDRELSLAAGMDDHVGKPIDVDALVNTVLGHCRPPVPVTAAPAAPPAAPVACVEFDKALARLGGNGSLYHSLVRTFAGEARVLLEKLEAAIEGGHLAEAGNVLRNFRSAAGIVGASRLGAIAIEEEQRLRSPGARLDGDAAQALLARVGKLTEQTLAELDRVLEKQRA